MDDLDTQSISRVQVKFFTRHTEYSIPDTTYSIPSHVSCKELCTFINKLLSDGSEETKKIAFDFLINGEILRLPLQQFLEQKEISLETVVEIEFIPSYPEPTPELSLACDDWVSAVRACEKWILTGCYDNTLHIWTSEGEHKLTIPGHIAPVKSVAWISIDNPVSIFVSTSHDETAVIWKWNQQMNAVECIHVCRGHARSVDCVDVSMCRRKVPLLTLSGHSEAVTGVQWIDMNELCSASMDNNLSLWDVEMASLKSQLNGSKPFFDISYSPLSRHIVSASADRHVRLWDPRIKDGSVVQCAFTSHNGWVSAVHWSPVSEHQFISGSYDSVLKLWDTRSPKVPLFNMLGHEEKILCVDWSTPNRIISGGADNYIKIFDSRVEVTKGEGNS
ncbi:ribosome biogenesis protein WDR12 homolog [Centruroides sculpturatus]|uniref:ribosome biogenesis protein WDR12 homolog n=1 Tax=Centruroides sculpturatus TaxID=218467 RepID=UPI000C6E3289|nr:ribosome biogenesis protein WDR12 homolog [Centruroides sculpturatus]